MKHSIPEAFQDSITEDSNAKKGKGKVKGWSPIYQNQNVCGLLPKKSHSHVQQE